MAVPFKKLLRKNPVDKSAPAKYYPQLVTLGNSVDLEYIADSMQRASSLSVGDIKSVLDNFVESMQGALYNGLSVNIKDFGVFSLTAKTAGTDTKEDCGVKCIKSVNINFRPSTTMKPSLVGTRGMNKIRFFDVEKGVVVEEEGGRGTNPGGGDGGGVIDPDA